VGQLCFFSQEGREGRAENRKLPSPWYSCHGISTAKDIMVHWLNPPLKRES
jgi:hypothetical protein